jgi:signal transduction histidine kinase
VRDGQARRHQALMRRLQARHRAHQRWHQRMHRRFRHSLRWRLVTLFVLLALATTLVFFGGVRMVLSGGYDGLVKPLLADYMDRLAAELGSPPDVERARALVARLPVAIRIEGPVVQWNSHPGRMVPLWGRHRLRDDDGEGDAGDGEAQFMRRTADGHRIHFGLADEVWRYKHPWLGLIPLMGVLLLTWAAYATVRRLFRPLDDIRNGTLRYGRGDFGQPIPVRRRDELGDLATQVNAMASGLQGMLQGQRALLLAISHELRSPLTRARLNAELSAETPERAALLRDLALMGELITDLLEGERLAAGAAALRREPTDLNTLLREVVDTQCAGLPLRLDLAAGLPALALDRPRVAMLARNLVDNACRHGAGHAGAEAAEPVQLSTRLDGDAVLLTVRDHGPGVPDEHLARLTEPFYRPDSARTRAAGGVGLGLYLCRLVAQSHGGTLTLRNASPGLEVLVRWPVQAV